MLQITLVIFMCNAVNCDYIEQSHIFSSTDVGSNAEYW